MPMVSTSFQHYVVGAIRTEKEIKGIQIGNEEVTLSSFADMFLSIGDPKNSTRKLLEVILKCSVTGYKINLQKSIASLFTNIKHPEKEIMGTLLFTTTSRK